MDANPIVLDESADDVVVVVVGIVSASRLGFALFRRVRGRLVAGR